METLNSSVAPCNISILTHARGTSPQTIDAVEVVTRIDTGYYAEDIAPIRALYQITLKSAGGDHKAAKKAVASRKTALPAVQWSGVFSARGDKRVTSYSGLLCADLDQLDEDTIAHTLEALTLDEHCYTAFVSPTGTGVKAVFRVSPEAENHQRNFEAVEAHVLKTHGLNVDPACSNVERLCFVSDGDAHLNETAVALPLLPVAAREPEASQPLASPAGRQAIATRLLGAIDWASETEGFGHCPGEHLHSGANGPQDFKVMLDGAPTVTCFHQSCAEHIETANQSLRSAIGRAELNAPGGDHFRSDVGYADNIVKRFAGVIRYCADEECWLTFDEEEGWRRDGTGKIKALAANYARELYDDACRQAQGMSQAAGKKFIASRVVLGNRQKIEAALAIVTTTPSVVVRAAELDADPFLVGVLNGVIDLKSGAFQPHRAEHLVTRRLDVHYDANATAPTWDRFFEQVQPDPEVRAFLQRLCGYSITGANREHVLPFHYGVGANGKGTFLEHAMLKMMGDYGAKLTDSLVYASDRGTPPHLEIANLCGKRFGLGEENSEAGRLNEAVLKAITGGDRQKGRFHYGNFAEYFPTYKIALVGNHKPRISGIDEGFWRRFLLINWPVMIPAEKRDGKLPEKLAAEMPGILNWCLAGARAWYADGLNPPASCTEATSDFRETSDSLAEFIAECFEKKPGGVVTKGDAYDAYKEWAGSQGQTRTMTKRSLAGQLVLRGWSDLTGRHKQAGCWLDYILRS